jgi:predicted metal-dependent phosphoesterase TrpH
MDAPELRHAAALIAAAFVTRMGVETPEDAARIYFRCLDALVAAAQEHKAERREVARKDRQPKPWAKSTKTTD